MPMRCARALLAACLVAGLFFNEAGPVMARQQGGRTLSSGPQPAVSGDQGHDLSAPLAELAERAARKPASASTPQTVREQPLGLRPDGGQPLQPENLATADALLQAGPLTASMPAALASFEGINNIDGVAPPDTNGDIGYDPVTGKKYYLQWVNLHLQAWDVSDPAAPVALFAAPLAGNAIWSGLGGPCQSNNDGDPIVLFDELAQRWMISQFAVSGPFYNCMAISKTGNPAGEYYRYAFKYSDTKMNDYPKFGIWPDGYYMSVNQFVQSGSNWSWGGVGVAVYERAQMLNGGTARQVVFDLESANNYFFGLLPADFEGTPPPEGAPAYFAAVDDSGFSGLGGSDALRIWQFSTNWTSGSYTFGLSGQPNQVLNVTDFNIECGTNRDCIPQPNSQKLDAIGDRAMYRLAYRNLDGAQRMVVNHTVNAGSGRAGVRWYELSASGSSWSIAQQGTYAGDTPTSDTAHRWMGSAALDRMGNLALGYSLSSGTLYPSIGIAGRLAGDPSGTLAQGERIIFSGTAAQLGVNRWGDYSSLSLDPLDGCTFWFTTEYSAGGWNWHTRILAFKFPNCTDAPTGTLSGTVTAAAGGAPIAGASVTVGLYSTVSAADGSYRLTLAAGSYTVGVTALGYQAASQAGVSVSAGATTTLNFALAAAPPRQVTGVVRDGTPGGHNWPLYARLTVAGYPGDIYSDPLTGAYSLALPEGSYNFSVQAMLPGYQTASAALTVAGDTTRNFDLYTDPSSCSAPGYAPGSLLLSQNFDGVSAGTLPSGWQTVGTKAGAWTVLAGTREPRGYTAPSAPNLVYFNSYSAPSGATARLYTSQALNLSGLAYPYVSFKMFHDPGYSYAADALQVAASTDGGTTWNGVGAALYRYSATASWQTHTVDLGAYAGAASLLLGFQGTSFYGNDIHLDDISLSGCSQVTGGLLLGNLSDANTSLALNDAQVTLSGGSTLSAAATPGDTALADGFYYGFAPASTTSAAAARLSYTGELRALSVANNSIQRQDFALKAGRLEPAPASFEVSLGMDSSTSRSLALSNTGGSALAYQVVETNLAQQLAPANPRLDPALRHLGPKNLNKTSLDGVAYYLPRQRSAQRFAPRGAGSLLTSFASGLAGPWGLGLDQASGRLWLGNPSANGGDNYDYEFSTAGSPTGKKISTAAWVADYAADMAYDPARGTLWQVNVGGDNCIYEFSPAGLAPTGNKICPAFGTSERGLAYDPASDTFLAGSWNDALIKRFDRSGAILEQVNVGLPVAGLAYNPASGHLFVANQGTSAAFDISVLDTKNAYANLGGFSAAALHGGQAGLELDCSGKLWAVNQVSKQVLALDSGESGVCDYAAIPWLTETPGANPALAAGSADSITLTFDAAGLQPGSYQAHLKLVSDTPYPVANVTLKLNVTLPANYGTLAGKLSGLAACDAPGAALAGAAVEVRSAAGALLASLVTAADGSYSWSGPLSGNPYTLSFSKSGYQGKSEALSLPAGTTLAHDASLRLDAPCLALSPTALEDSLPQGHSGVLPVTLSNSGAAAADYRLLSDVLLDEGFEGSFPPAGWTTQASNSVYTWKTSSYAAHSGAQGAYVEWDFNQDEWLLTPAFTLSSATLSLWSSGSVTWCMEMAACSLNVWLVVGAPGGGDDIFVGNLAQGWVADWEWAQSTFVLDGLLPASQMRIGIEYTGNDGESASVDDLRLSLTNSTASWLSAAPSAGSLAAAGGTVEISAGFSAAGRAVGGYATRLYAADQLNRLVSIPASLQVLANATPSTAADAYSLDEDSSLNVPAAAGLLANDSDAEGDPFSAALLAGPAHGVLALNADGSFSYTPAANFNGSDGFSYRASDGLSSSGATSVSLTVRPVNDLPSARADTYTCANDTLLVVAAAAGLLANDGDVDGDPLTALLVSGPAYGTLELHADGSFRYTPVEGYLGPILFTYQASDGTGLSAETAVTLTITSAQARVYVPLVNK